MTPRGHISLTIAAVVGIMGLTLLILFLCMEKGQLEEYQIMLSISVPLTCLWIAGAMVINAFDDEMKGE